LAKRTPGAADVAGRPPCRLFVIPARDRPVALILRRGPAAWYHLILWNTATDALEHGAWFRGRIYEERCDLSPDGELFLYFALQGRRWRTSYEGAWTAVSRPPWLHALALWPQGHTWGGGGRFLDRRRAVLWSCDLRTHPDHPLVGLEVSSGSPSTQEREVRRGEWTGRDYAGNVVYTREGRLYRNVVDRGRTTTVEIADFNGLRPDPQPAPDWAHEPLRQLRASSRRTRGVRPGRRPPPGCR
jgi:hypothetical protein